VDEGRVQEAEDLIVEDWNENDAIGLRLSVHRVQNLYGIVDAERQERDEPDVGHERAVLIAEAIDNHRDGRYASARGVIPVSYRLRQQRPAGPFVFLRGPSQQKRPPQTPLRGW
jgi:hypothetical protein